jgi:glycolate oxidase iron-sulfur subunit
MAVSDAPRQVDLDRCVHCGLCLNACPTYRELGVEMDSPRGRIYQMAQVAGGAPITPTYIEHIELCLACRGCESACPSGVPYGRLVEAARAEIDSKTKRSLPDRLVRGLVFDRLLPSPRALRLAGSALYLYREFGIQRVLRSTGVLRILGRLGELEKLAPAAEAPFFFRHTGQVFPARENRRYRVAFLGGCIANVSFARLNEATIRVLQANDCEVVVPKGQTCCGALHVHAGRRDRARRLARTNIDAVLDGGFDAIITNAAGCGSTLKEYGELLEGDARAERFATMVKDVCEFLASIERRPAVAEVRARVTYQDSCHLAHGQKVRAAPRKLLKSVPGLELKEMPLADICCGSAGIYNVTQTEMSMALLERKMRSIQSTSADRIATANPGCMLQLRAGVEMYGGKQLVQHVVEILDEAYRPTRR